MILPAQHIMTEGIIHPFHRRSQAFGLSYGLSAAGYDIRSATAQIVAEDRLALISSIECFDMPDDVMGFVADKSTHARCGLFVQNTIIEPGWRGYLTLELTYQGPEKYFNIPVGLPIAQVVFARLEAPTEQPYQGKYQDQKSEPVKAILTNYEREQAERNER